MKQESQLLTDFKIFIEEQELFDSQEHVLLAVSGGVDSMVMADLFLKSQLKFSIAHCNFLLRGDESDQDKKFVEDYAAKIDVPFYSKQFDTKDYAHKKGISIQMAARQLRYGWFKKLASLKGFDKIATAHQKDDSFETVLMNLVRGTGYRGISGIPVKCGNIIRPLLFASKEEIMDHARHHINDWREDTSNVSDNYKRNLIRNKVIPHLREINPNLNKTFESTTERLASARIIFENFLKDLKKSSFREEGKHTFIKKSKFKNDQYSPAYLHELIKEYGFNYEQSREIIKSITSTGKIFLSQDYILNIDRKELIISENTQDQNKVEIRQEEQYISCGNFHFDISIDLYHNDFIVQDRNQAYLDFNKLNFPLILRKWEPGDVFYPLGMKGKKKLSDFMIDRKIPLNLKKNIMVLLSEDDIVWVVGHMIDDRYKVTELTQKIYSIKVSKDDQSV